LVILRAHPITADLDPDHARPSLSAAQEAAAAVLRDAARDSFSVSLLDGVTGSGKTEVYFEAVAETLKRGRQALILLPEIALTGALAREALGLQEEFALATACGHAETAARLLASLERLERRQDAIPFLDDPDMRFRNRVWRPEPIAKAVMFCLMDVSASMDEVKKDLAKRFYALLYMFLTRKYEQVDLVFIRHTDDAEEVDEETFFHDPRSGGTVVYSALELADKIRSERYATGWNVYAAQASDGDAFGADPAKSARYLRERLLPVARYYTYLELAGGEAQMRSSSLWVEYERIQADAKNFAMRRAWGRDQIYPVFRELFRKEGQ